MRTRRPRRQGRRGGALARPLTSPRSRETPTSNGPGYGIWNLSAVAKKNEGGVRSTEGAETKEEGGGEEGELWGAQAHTGDRNVPVRNHIPKGRVVCFSMFFVIELRRRVLTMMVVNCAINPPTVASTRQHQLGKRTAERRAKPPGSRTLVSPWLSSVRLRSRPKQTLAY